jgi:hypothetical protein
MIVASASVPSENTTLSRFAPATTCRLVSIVPLSRITTPVPTLRSVSLSVSSSPPRPRTRTTEPLMTSYACAAREGSALVSSVRSTAASMSFWVSTRCAGTKAACV